MKLTLLTALLLTLLTALLLAPLATLHAADAPEPPVASTESASLLWDSNVPMPKAADLPLVAGAEFHVIKPHEPKVDGYRFLHGVALGWHKGKLYASYAASTLGEGCAHDYGEEAHVRVSGDGGKTWGPAVVIAGNTKQPVSHGAFLSHAGRLWAFMGAYSLPPPSKLHTRAYTLNESTGAWEPQGVVIENGFWPMHQPQRMADGNWIMAGFSGQKVGAAWLPAVAISKGDDFTKWEMVVIQAVLDLGSIWGECAVIVEGKRILNISRYGKNAVALLSVSEDFGRTWTPTAPSNLPMETSKPSAGTLSTGQRFLVCTTTADTTGGFKRSPLTIAVSKPGETAFSKVFVIRHAGFPAGPGESHPKAALAYPYAVEHDGKLYVGYSNSGGGVGRVGTGSSLANNNSAEMAVIAIRSLEIKP
jgi:hypothetical protein